MEERNHLVGTAARLIREASVDVSVEDAYKAAQEGLVRRDYTLNMNIYTKHFIPPTGSHASHGGQQS
jgi:hypothetical protein